MPESAELVPVVWVANDSIQTNPGVIAKVQCLVRVRPAPRYGMVYITSSALAGDLMPISTTFDNDLSNSTFHLQVKSSFPGPYNCTCKYKGREYTHTFHLEIKGLSSLCKLNRILRDTKWP